MHAYRGRGGPSKSTPANVQCQKCLKRGHYSYECKAPAQERPYVPRPSRTQQLLNPKLVPKLTTEVPDDLQKKKGVADEELAKREAERARKGQLEEDEEDERRQRSASSGSASSVSSRSVSRIRADSPPSRIVSPPPVASKSRHSRDVSPLGRRERQRAWESESDDSARSVQSRSRDGRAGAGSRRHISPQRYSGRKTSSRRDSSMSSDGYGARSDPRRDRRHGRRSQSPNRPSHRERSRSRSPTHTSERRYRERDAADGARMGHQRPIEPPKPPPERSLSPFSKRLALTQAMNSGR